MLPTTFLSEPDSDSAKCINLTDEPAEQNRCGESQSNSRTESVNSEACGRWKNERVREIMNGDQDPRESAAAGA